MELVNELYAFGDTLKGEVPPPSAAVFREALESLPGVFAGSQRARRQHLQRHDAIEPAMPGLQHQPPDASHRLLRLDPGLLLDFLCCLAVYGTIRLGAAHARRWRPKA